MGSYKTGLARKGPGRGLQLKPKRPMVPWDKHIPKSQTHIRQPGVHTHGTGEFKEAIQGMLRVFHTR